MKSKMRFGMSRREVLKMAAAGGAGLAMLGPLARTVKASDQYSSVVLAKGPVGYWRLGEASGPTAPDASGNGYDGTYLGNPTFGQAGAILNDPDTAIGLNGPASKDYVEISDPDSAAFSQPTSGVGLTVEVWMRPDVLTFPGQTSDIYIHWLGKGDRPQLEWALRFYSQDSPTRPNRISAYIWNPNDPPPALGAGAFFQDVLTPGQWIHVVGVYEPGDKDTDPPAGVRIYRDGIFRQGPLTSSGTWYRSFGIVPAHGTLPLRLGTRDAATSGVAAVSYFNGGLDEVAIYPRVLGDDEIRENYCVGSERCF
jgi:Concanavalin A-like lectin/glucanases superfamily